jgi:hypothetical protein
MALKGGLDPTQPAVDGGKADQDETCRNRDAA